MIQTPIPFEIPLQYLGQIDAGELMRYGGILKDTQTGKIVAHLQETGVFEQVWSSASSLAPNIVSEAVPGLGVALNAFQTHQTNTKLNQLTDMFSNLQTLNLVGTVASVAGIGVTVIGTAMVLQRIGAVNRGIERIEAKIDNLPQKWREMDLHKTLRHVGTLLERLAEANSRKAATAMEKDLDAVQEGLRQSFNELHDGARVVLMMDVADEDLLRTLLAGMATASAAQMKSLVRLDEIDLARQRSQTQAEKLLELSMVVPTDILSGKMAGGHEAARRVSRDMSELRAVAASRPAFCETLTALEVSGPRYLAEASERDDAAILVLPSA